MRSPHTAAALLWLGAGFSGCGCAAATPTAPSTPPATSGILVGRLAPGSEYGRIWSLATLYQSDRNPLIEELAVLGQLQTQYAYGSDASGNFGSQDFPDAATWGNAEVRRMRVGLKARVFGKLSFLNLTDLYPDLSPRVYKRTPETYLTYAGSEAFNLSVGKTELKFNREQEYSSRDLLPFERTALGNMLYGGELTGAWACGSGIAGGWLYHVGLYSNDRVDEWSDLSGGSMILTKIGYNYTRQTSLDLAEAKFQYLHNTEPGYTESASCTASPSYSDCISISNQLASGPYGMTTEFLWAKGAKGRPDVCGVMAMPTYSFSDKVQGVATFEFAGSREANGVILPARYEALAAGAGDKRGDAYLAGYLGLNYYFYGQKFKLMSGVKTSYLDGGPGGGGFNGWTWLAGCRIAF